MSAPQPYPPYPQPTEGFVITTQFFPLSWMFATVKPVIAINGWVVPNTVWGRNVLPAPPGQYHLHVHTPYFLPRRVGPAEGQAVVSPGQWIELEYKAPLWAYSGGSLGRAPQKYNGAALLIGVMAATFVVAFLAFFLFSLLPLLAH